MKLDWKCVLIQLNTVFFYPVNYLLLNIKKFTCLASML